MTLNRSDIIGISNTLKNLTENNDINNIIQESVNGITANFKDPVGNSIYKTSTRLNSLLGVVESKIADLENNIIKSIDNTGRVELKDNNIVISIDSQDITKSNEIKRRIETNITQINNNISKLNLIINTLSVLNSTAINISRALDIQEKILSLNPVSKATLTVFKKAIKILFYKDVLSEYSRFLSRELNTNKLIINNLSNKFKNLRVQININDSRNEGSFITEDEGEKMIPNQLLYGNQYITEQFTANNLVSYKLVVEKYSDRAIIGRAYESFSGLIKTQTAPTLSSSPEDLMQEMKIILNNNL